MREYYTFASILKCLRVILVLTQNGTELQLELALLVDSAVSHWDLLVLVEFRVADQRNALLEIENALIKHPKLLEAHAHVIVRDKRDVSVPRASFQAHNLQRKNKIWWLQLKAKARKRRGIQQGNKDNYIPQELLQSFVKVSALSHSSHAI